MAQKLSKETFAASVSASAGVGIPPGVAPTSPVDGDVWTTTAGIFVRINGVTVGPLQGPGSLPPTSQWTATAAGGPVYGYWRNTSGATRTVSFTYGSDQTQSTAAPTLTVRSSTNAAPNTYGTTVGSYSGGSATATVTGITVEDGAALRFETGLSGRTLSGVVIPTG